MSCGPKQYPVWDGFSDIEETKIFRAINADSVKLLLAVGTFVIALLAYFKSK